MTEKGMLSKCFNTKLEHYPYSNSHVAVQQKSIQTIMLNCANRWAENEYKHLHKPRVLAPPETGASFHYPEDSLPEMDKVRMKPGRIPNSNLKNRLTKIVP